MKHKFGILLLFVLLIGCAPSKPIDDYSHYLRNKDIPAPTLDAFPHCYDYGCRTIKMASVTAPTWEKLEALFIPAAANATEERNRIAKTIQLFEQDIGAQTGTSADLKGTFRPFTRHRDKPLRFQQDCVDESTNTTIYLSLLAQKGWLKYHRVTQPQSRQPLINGNHWWHQSATIRDIETKQQYAVDSWFGDNGQRAHIVPLDLWFKNWKPKFPSEN